LCDGIGSRGNVASIQQLKLQQVQPIPLDDPNLATSRINNLEDSFVAGSASAMTTNSGMVGVMGTLVVMATLMLTIYLPIR